MCVEQEDCFGNIFNSFREGRERHPRDEAGDGIRHLGQTLTPGPSPVSLAWAAQRCASNFAGLAPSSPIGVVGPTPGREISPYSEVASAASSTTLDIAQGCLFQCSIGLGCKSFKEVKLKWQWRNPMSVFKTVPSALRVHFSDAAPERLKQPGKTC